jgi:3-dehydroquinate synthase
MPSVNVALGDRSYPVIIGKGILGQSELWHQHLPGGKILVVTNEVVAPLYLDQLGSVLGHNAFQSLILPDGESTKTISNWSLILDRLIEMKAGRDVCLIALGGGVIGDICGFVAATYMRGVPFIQVPTTLLAQVDSSVGGKTAVNHVEGKNLVGAFHQPIAVIADTDTLNTLPDREIRAGMAEVVKYGAIRDAGFFEWLESQAKNIISRDATALAWLIEKSVRNKAEVVAEDEREAGARALLNFGHTFGHALETVTGYSDFLHGEAVSIGMVTAARLSESRGLCPAGVSMRISKLLISLGLPVTLPGKLSLDRFMEAMALDKKVLAGQLRLVLLTELGCAVIDDSSSTEEIHNCLLESSDD